MFTRTDMTDSHIDVITETHQNNNSVHNVGTQIHRILHWGHGLSFAFQLVGQFFPHQFCFYHTNFNDIMILEEGFVSFEVDFATKDMRN